MPLTEEIGLIDELGCQIIDHAVAAVQELDLGPAARVSVNVSALQLQSERIFEQVADLAVRAPQLCAGLCLEMTEQHLVDESDLTLERIQRLVSYGVGLAVDDFGTGYSSLGALHRLPAHQLKIDRRLCSRVGTAAGDAVVSAAVGVARAYRMTTVAEGVQTPDQARRLRDLDVDLMQGYLFARPEPLAALQARLRRAWPWEVAAAELDRLPATSQTA